MLWNFTPTLFIPRRISAKKIKRRFQDPEIARRIKINALKFVSAADSVCRLNIPEPCHSPAPAAKLLFGLYTFRHNAHMQALSHADNQADDIQIVFLLRNIDDKRAVDFNFIEREVATDREE